MTTIFNKFSRSLIGVEIRHDSLVISCLENDLSGLQLIASSVFPLRDDDDTVSEINSFLTEYVTGYREVFVTIPHHWTITKFTEIPFPKTKGKDAIVHMMRFEIERHVPYQIDDILFDFQVVGKEKSTFKVLFSAVHREKIDHVKDLLGKMNLDPVLITLDTVAVQNAVELSGSSAGGWQSLLGVVGKPRIFGQRGERCISLFFGTAEVCYAFYSDSACVSIGSFAYDRNIPQDDFEQDILNRLSSMVTELNLGSVNKVTLSGYTEPVSGLKEGLSEKFSAEVMQVKTLSKLAQPGGDRDTAQITASTGACYRGLEIGSLTLNLLPHKASIKLGKTGPLIAKISLPVIVLLIIGIFAGEISYDRRLLAAINERISANDPEIKTIEKLTSDIREMERKKNTLKVIKESNVIIDILLELTQIIPTDTWLTNFRYKLIRGQEGDKMEGDLVIQGFAGSSSTLIAILEDSDYFESVEFVGSIKKRMGKEEFKIRVVTVNINRASDKVPAGDLNEAPSEQER